MRQGPQLSSPHKMLRHRESPSINSSSSQCLSLALDRTTPSIVFRPYFQVMILVSQTQTQTSLTLHKHLRRVTRTFRPCCNGAYSYWHACDCGPEKVLIIPVRQLQYNRPVPHHKLCGGTCLLNCELPSTNVLFMRGLVAMRSIGHAGCGPVVSLSYQCVSCITECPGRADMSCMKTQAPQTGTRPGECQRWTQQGRAGLSCRRQ